MATKGTEDDPHLWLITGDGAGLSRAESGVRVGLYAGSTEFVAEPIEYGRDDSSVLQGM